MQNKGEIKIYQNNSGTEVQVKLENETIWLSQEQISVIFGVKRPAITKHINNIFESGELDEKVVCSKMEHTTQHGSIKEKTQTKKASYYNLDMIISVGYRVNSKQATSFRIWATSILKDYLIKGYAVNTKTLQEKGYKELEQTLQLFKNTLKSGDLSQDEAYDL